MKGPPLVVPIPSWAGWYIGANAGVALDEITRFNDKGDPRVGSSKQTGFIGGGQIGYNWQEENFVYGLEVDGSGLAAKWTGIASATGATFTNELPWLVTARARVGLAVSDTLVYATAGLAVGEIKTAGTSANILYSQSKTRTGWVAGGGVEHKFRSLPNWSFAFEALFLDLGARTYCTKNCTLRRVTGQATIARAKANYHF